MNEHDPGGDEQDKIAGMIVGGEAFLPLDYVTWSYDRIAEHADEEVAEVLASLSADLQFGQIAAVDHYRSRRFRRTLDVMTVAYPLAVLPFGIFMVTTAPSWWVGALGALVCSAAGLIGGQAMSGRRYHKMAQRSAAEVRDLIDRFKEPPS